MKLAYADPPYYKCAYLYTDKHEDAKKWDTLEAHQDLIESMLDYDAWAMSLSSTSMQYILPMCPTDVRVAAWVKPFASFKPGINPAYAWEPVIFRGGRKRTRVEDTVRDWVSANITLQKGLAGAKPMDFCLWILDLLGYEEGDEFVDLFPGTNSMAQALSVKAGTAWKQAPLFKEDA